MEEAFFLKLKHLLPKKNQYLIVADRGFGNFRIMNILEKFGFNYLIRIKESLKMKFGIAEIDLTKIPKQQAKYSKIVIKTDPEKKDRFLTVSFSKDKNLKQGWFCLKCKLNLFQLTFRARRVSNLEFNKLQNIYKNRFQIEKTFQDQKSSGFSCNLKSLEASSSCA